MTLYGVDVSQYQPHVDWSALVRDGYGSFAYARCCEGTTLDPLHAVHVLNARAAGVPIGSYQFGHPSQDCATLVAAFLAHAHLIELRPVIDMETLSDGHVPTNAASWADDWCERVKAATGLEPIIYASTSYWRTMLVLKPEIGGPLGWDWWAAQFGGTRPPLSIAWQERGNVALPHQVGLWDVDSVDAPDVGALRV